MSAYCSNCSSAFWQLCGACIGCEQPGCDLCMNSPAGTNDLVCATCVRERYLVDGVPIEEYAAEQAVVLEYALPLRPAARQCMDVAAMVPEFRELAAK